jgi:alkanesulfonate monooxygenase SsuD/methylene tetrahydromethanopterin reductase-like flavin-dependent oxidoreductase (luciferase family)
MLREELEIIRSLWTIPRTNLDGHYYKVLEAINSPKPVQEPYPEILIAFKSKRYLPAVAAEFADRVNLLGADDAEVKMVMDAVAEHCPEYDRDFNKIIFGGFASLIFMDDKVQEVDIPSTIRNRAIEIGADPEELLGEHEGYTISYVGPISGCAEALRKRTVDIGVREVVICIDTLSENSYERTMEGLREFTRRVMPELKRA